MDVLDPLSKGSTVTLNEAAYNILNLLRGGRSSNNDYYSIEQIKFTIGYYRSLILRRDLERNGRTFEVEQDLGMIGLELIDPGEGYIPQFNGLVMRTSRDIPTTVRLKDRLGITSVNSPDRRFAFPLVDFQAARHMKYGKYTGKTARSFFLENRVYLIGDPMSTAINAILNGVTTIAATPSGQLIQPMHIVVRGVFEDPRKVYEFQNPEDEWDDEMEYPLPGDIYQRIVQSLLSGEFKVLTSTPTDMEANNVPDTNG